MLPPLPPSSQANASSTAPGSPTASETSSLPLSCAEIVPLADMERRYIERAIDLYQGNIQLAARKLGISASTIYRKKEGWGP